MLASWVPFCQEAPFFIWYSERFRVEFELALRAHEIHVHEIIYWDKPVVIGMMDYHPNVETLMLAWRSEDGLVLDEPFYDGQYETVLYGWKRRPKFYGERTETNVWPAARDPNR